jgi:hypothetical protein
MHARRALAAAFAVTLALAACGGDDDGSDETTTTTEAEETTTTAAESTTTTEEATTTTEAPADDPEAIAQAVNLTADDFTSDWTAEPNDDEEDDLDVTLCFVDSDLAGNTLAEADSDGFSQESDTAVIQVGSTGIVTSGVGVASTILGEATRSAFSECVLDQFEASVTEDGDFTFTGGSLVPASGGSTSAEQVVVLSGDLSIQDTAGTAYDFQLSMQLHRQGEVIAGVSVLSLGDTDFDAVVASSNRIVGERLVEVVG